MGHAGKRVRNPVGFRGGDFQSRHSPGNLAVALELPSNEAVISAAREGLCATVVSGAVAAPLLTQGLLVKVRFHLPSRQFAILRHKQRHSSRASLALETICREDKAAEVKNGEDWAL